VKVIGHPATSVNLPARLRSGFVQRPQKSPAIQVIAEDRLASVTPVHQMTDRSARLDP
jgi:hypothetical protein